MDETVVELLEKPPIFFGLTERQLTMIAIVSKKAFFQPGETIVKQGEAGDAAYLIRSGKAVCSVIEDGLPVERDIWPGTLVGELAMLVETHHAFTIVAKEKTRVFTIQRDDLRKVLEADPAIAQHMADKLLMRLHGLAADLRKVDDTLAAIEAAA